MSAGVPYAHKGFTWYAPTEPEDPVMYFLRLGPLRLQVERTPAEVGVGVAWDWTVRGVELVANGRIPGALGAIAAAKDAALAAAQKALAEALDAAWGARNGFRLFAIADCYVAAKGGEVGALVAFLESRGALVDTTEKRWPEVRLGDLARHGEDGWLFDVPVAILPHDAEAVEWLARQTEPRVIEPDDE